MLRDDDQHVHEVMDRLSPSVFAGLLTVTGVLTYANKAALDTIGARAEDVLGLLYCSTPPPWWRFSDQSRKHLREAILAAGRDVASRFDVPILDRNGRVRTMDFTLHPVYDDSGSVTDMVPSARDITESRQAERELRLTQFAVDHARGAMLQIDAEGRVRYANRAACCMLGYCRRALTGRSLSDIDSTSQQLVLAFPRAITGPRYGAESEYTVFVATGRNLLKDFLLNQTPGQIFIYWGKVKKRPR